MSNCPEFPGDLAHLSSAVQSVAEANVYAAELLIDLELTRAELEAQNDALAQAKREAEESARCKSIFLATMSHELRTPLNAIIGYCELVTEDATELGQTGMCADLGRIHTAAEHLLRLISEILDFSKMEAGKMPVHLEAVPVDELLVNVADTVQPLVVRQGNRLVRESREAGLVVNADRMRVTQCLLNLLSNAARFTTAGEIRLEAWRYAPGFINIQVIDTGAGIEEAFLDQLFEPFTQAGERPQSGTGLGLAISRRLARLMDGELTATSRLGEGSTFTLTLRERPA